MNCPWRSLTLGIPEGELGGITSFSANYLLTICSGFRLHMATTQAETSTYVSKSWKLSALTGWDKERIINSEGFGDDRPCEFPITTNKKCRSFGNKDGYHSRELEAKAGVVRHRCELDSFDSGHD